MQIDIVASASQPVKSQNKTQEGDSFQTEKAKEENNEAETFTETKITKLDVDDFPDLTKEPNCILFNVLIKFLYLSNPFSHFFFQN